MEHDRTPCGDPVSETSCVSFQLFFQWCGEDVPVIRTSSIFEGLQESHFLSCFYFFALFVDFIGFPVFCCVSGVPVFKCTLPHLEDHACGPVLSVAVVVVVSLEAKLVLTMCPVDVVEAQPCDAG